MRTYHFLIISVCLLSSSCAQPMMYNGEKRPRTSTVEVYSSANEIKRPYKVMGRIIGHKYADDIVKTEMMKYAKSIGADGVIILGVDKTVTGKPNRVIAEAIKYN
jgi:hypothetical protein